MCARLAVASIKGCPRAVHSHRLCLLLGLGHTIPAIPEAVPRVQASRFSI